MSGFQSIIEKAKKERAIDKERWEKLDPDICQVCDTKGDDRRTLFITCLYNLKEASPKFIDLFDTPQRPKGYALRICKGCRAILLAHLHEWISKKGRLVDRHLDDDGICGYSEEEFRSMQK